MRNYTIFGVIDGGKPQTNHARDEVVWDGPAKTADILNAAKMLADAKKYDRVQVFCGKTLGKLVHEFS